MTHKQVCLATNWRFLCRNIVFMGSIESSLVFFVLWLVRLSFWQEELINQNPSFCKWQSIERVGRKRTGRTCIWNAREILYWYSSYHQIGDRMSEKRKTSILMLLMSGHHRWNLALLLCEIWSYTFMIPLYLLIFFKAMQLKSSLLTIKVLELTFYILSLFLTVWGFLVE